MEMVDPAGCGVSGAAIFHSDLDAKPGEREAEETITRRRDWVLTQHV
jgi:hypothetical protein